MGNPCLPLVGFVKRTGWMTSDLPLDPWLSPSYVGRGHPGQSSSAPLTHSVCCSGCRQQLGGNLWSLLPSLITSFIIPPIFFIHCFKINSSLSSHFILFTSTPIFLFYMNWQNEIQKFWLTFVLLQIRNWSNRKIIGKKPKYKIHTFFFNCTDIFVFHFSSCPIVMIWQ